MITIKEIHFCKNCNRELTEDEAYNTFEKGCKYCGAKDGFISFEDHENIVNNPTSYLDLYLQTLKNFEGRY